MLLKERQHQGKQRTNITLGFAGGGNGTTNPTTPTQNKHAGSSCFGLFSVVQNPRHLDSYVLMFSVTSQTRTFSTLAALCFFGLGCAGCTDAGTDDLPASRSP